MRKTRDAGTVRGDFPSFSMTDTNAGYPRLFFLHLLVILALYVSVVSTIVLLFQYIDLLFPDPLNFYLRGILDSIRWSTAIVLITFPVLVASTWFINRDLAAHPDHAEFRIRKWLLTFTIFLAALIIIGDLVTLIYNFLSGELTGSFLCKVAVVLLIAAAVFVYELRQLRRSDFGRSAQERLIAWGSSAVMVGIVVMGLVLAGSPMQQRKVRIDDQRTADLQSIQYQVIEYWVQKQKLPASLAELDSPLTGFTVPKDPTTAGDYEYRIVKSLQFELCATFETDNVSDTSGMTKPVPVGVYPVEPYGSEHWQHKAERTCFNRAIDPELYRDRIPPAMKAR